MSRALAEHLRRLSASFSRWTGRDLVARPSDVNDLARQLFEAPFVLLSHGTESDPILNYGNRMALTLWETDWERFTRMPSRLTAEPLARGERARVLADVARQGYTDTYRGVRISTGGRRFLIERAVVWTIVDADGRYQGQAAMFEQWMYLD
ncbi:MAG: MEKHLA domain-containing protein [Nitrospirota bacterium]